MAKRRRSKKLKKKVMRSLTTLVLLLIIGVISMILQPWQYLDGGQGGEKDPVGDRTEANVTDLQVHYIDVGQADSILIRVPTENGTKNMLIDAGTEGSSSDKIVTDYLNSLGIDTLTYMIITHPHEDHASAAKEVIEAVNIENLIFPECEATQKFWLGMLEAMDAKNLEYIPSKMGDTYQIGDASFEILGPVDDLKIVETNDYSVVIRLDYGENKFLFTGDAEDSSEEAMLEVWPASKFDCDVLKVGHHGSESSTTSAFLAAADPSLAIIMCGEGNKHGHPDSVVVERLQKANIPILRTDLEGTIIICSDKKEVYRLTK
jgi:competence protein ComEC